jgi:hypothetical protein
MAIGFKTPTYPDLAYTSHQRGPRYVAPVPPYTTISGAEGGLPATTNSESAPISSRYYIYGAVLAVAILGSGYYYDYRKARKRG